MLLTKMLYRGFGFWRLTGGLAGALLGWLLLFGGMQCWLLVERHFLPGTELLAPEYFIINKPMPFLNLFGQSGVAFTSNEIARIQYQPWATAVAPFVASRFKIQASFGANTDDPRLTTELFFEAVPGEFLDVKGVDWRWRPGENVLPIIIPRDYLALYNFGFAQSRSLPQISENLIGKVPFHLRLQGQGREADFKGQLAGFSQRINSILVPVEFLVWANAEFGTGPALPLRLMVKTANPTAPQVLQYFTEKGYQYNTEQAKTAKLGAALRFLMGIVGAFGLVVLVLALWLLALSFQLLIARNSERLQKLIWLGYPPARLVNGYWLSVALLVLVVNLASWRFLAWGTGWLRGWLARYGYAVDPLSLGSVGGAMVLLSLCVLAANYLILRKQIYRLA